jgi:hypothetical protein
VTPSPVSLLGTPIARSVTKSDASEPPGLDGKTTKSGYETPKADRSRVNWPLARLRLIDIVDAIDVDLGKSYVRTIYAEKFD